jgi:hypothetical protein
MNRSMRATTVAAAGFMAVAMMVAPLAQAQYGEGNRFSPASVSTLIDRVHDDLNHAYGVWKFSDSDRGRLNNAEKQLREFAQKWSKLKFDRGELDDAIGAIQHVLDENKLPADGRDALSDDVTKLRQLRDAYDHHEIG